MKKSIAIIAFVGFLFQIQLNAQLTLTNGDNSLEISGSISTYYNFRSLDSGIVEKDKNRFSLRDAQIQLEGRKGKNWEYELQFDLADLAQTSVDPENPGLMDAYIKYKGFRFFQVRMGYGKIEWSRSSLTPFVYSAYWQRAEFLRGNMSSRRDVGVDLSKSFWKQRAQLNLGIYTGLGEQSLGGDNDASGALEYTGRFTLGWPTQYRYREIDDRKVKKTMFGLGVQARYTERNLPDGEFFPAGAAGEYGIKVINGKKLGYGFDAAFQWKGFSAQFEIQQFKITPQDTNSSFFYGYSVEQTGGHFYAGGWTSQINYSLKKLNLIVSARYEDYNINDLLVGNNERFSAAIAYQFDDFRSMIKAQFIHIIQEENIDTPDWKQQFRIGWQYQF